MKQYSTYLFDFDGTTFDTKESLHKVFRDVFEAVGMTCTDEQAEEYMHYSLQETIERRKIPAEKIPLAARACELSINSPETIAKNRPFPETEETLVALAKRGAGVSFVSGNTAEHIGLVLSHWDFPKVYGILMGSDIFKRPKPNPEPILLACERLGIAPNHDVVYVGDSLQDIVAGTAAGVDVILIDREDEHPDFAGVRIHSLKELLS